MGEVRRTSGSERRRLPVVCVNRMSPYVSPYSSLPSRYQCATYTGHTIGWLAGALRCAVFTDARLPLSIFHCASRWRERSLGWLHYGHRSSRRSRLVSRSGASAQRDGLKAETALTVALVCLFNAANPSTRPGRRSCSALPAARARSSSSFAALRPNDKTPRTGDPDLRPLSAVATLDTH